MGNRQGNHPHDEENQPAPNFQAFDLAAIRRTPGYRIEAGDGVHMTLRGQQEATPIPPGETPIEALQLNIRTYSCLKRSELQYVSQVIKLGDNELLALRNFSTACLANLKEQLEVFGFQQ